MYSSLPTISVTEKINDCHTEQVKTFNYLAIYIQFFLPFQDIKLVTLIAWLQKTNHEAD